MAVYTPIYNRKNMYLSLYSDPLNFAHSNAQDLSSTVFSKKWSLGAEIHWSVYWSGVESNFGVEYLGFLMHILALIIIIIGFLINMQVQGHHPHQWAPFQVTG